VRSETTPRRPGAGVDGALDRRVSLVLPSPRRRSRARGGGVSLPLSVAMVFLAVGVDSAAARTASEECQRRRQQENAPGVAAHGSASSRAGASSLFVPHPASRSETLAWAAREGTWRRPAIGTQHYGTYSQGRRHGALGAPPARPSGVRGRIAMAHSDAVPATQADVSSRQPARAKSACLTCLVNSLHAMPLTTAVDAQGRRRRLPERRSHALTPSARALGRLLRSRLTSGLCIIRTLWRMATSHAR